jgi:hypothetical protein
LFPEDLTDEVGAVEAAVEEINAALSRDFGRRLDVITWRNTAAPGVSTDPQAVINEDVGDDYNLFIDILWTRFGAPTPRAGSGTEEEFERAYTRYKASPGSVRVMFYFKRAPIDFEQIVPAQIEAIDAFRAKLGPKGVLYWDFSSPDVEAAASYGKTLSQLFDNMESFRKSMVGLRGSIQGLPRFTTHFNRAKRLAVEAIDDCDRFAGSGIELPIQLRRNFDALVSFFRAQDRTPSDR